MRKALFLALVAIFTLTLASVAYAGLGVHEGPGFATDTDACAGCHRSHTATSPITLALPPYTTTSALLTSGTTTQEFCYTCHGDAATGAYTNVEDGVFELTNGTGEARDGLAGTKSADGGVLNGGGFASINGTTTSSQHNLEATGTMWGEGVSGPGRDDLTLKCTNCHDAHGSNNYRSVLFDPETEEDAGPSGNLTVRSTEDIYGTTKNLSTVDFTQDGSGAHPYLYQSGMSEWCTDCHEQYMTVSSTYDAGDGEGGVTRYRHTMDVDITGYQYGGLPVPSTTLPLESADDLPAPGRGNSLNCITCHRAHGTAATMTDKATVAPTNDSALLRLNNRGVCQNCHDK